MTTFDPPTKAILATLADLGYVVGLGPDGDAYRVTAQGQDGQTHVMRADNAYLAVCELAGQLGVELDFGNSRVGEEIFD